MQLTANHVSLGARHLLIIQYKFLLQPRIMQQSHEISQGFLRRFLIGDILQRPRPT